MPEGRTLEHFTLNVADGERPATGRADRRFRWRLDLRLAVQRLPARSADGARADRARPRRLAGRSPDVRLMLGSAAHDGGAGRHGASQSARPRDRRGAPHSSDRGRPRPCAAARARSGRSTRSAPMRTRWRRCLRARRSWPPTKPAPCRRPRSARADAASGACNTIRVRFRRRRRHHRTARRTSSQRRPGPLAQEVAAIVADFRDLTQRSGAQGPGLALWRRQRTFWIPGSRRRVRQLAQAEVLHAAARRDVAALSRLL